jgi:cytochrome c oxidase cbb3-type subunit 3
MSTFWSLFIIVLTVGMILATVWLIIITGRMRVTKREDNSTGHVWDGDITEYNNPLPRWWLWLFWFTIVFGIFYLVLYPGMGDFKGIKGWTQTGQYDAEVAEAMEAFEQRFASLAAQPLESLADNAEAVQIGRNLFAHHCSTCHGTDAAGFTGYPNLTDEHWLWGSSPQAVLTSIQQGRRAAMPAWQNALGETGVTEVTVYLQSLNGVKADPALAANGAKRYQQLCVACHGADANGNVAMGAPALNNNNWLYGGSYEAIRHSIANGRNGNMPAHLEILGESRSRLVAAYVLSLQQAEETARADTQHSQVVTQAP